MAIFGTLGLFTRHIALSSAQLALLCAVLALLFVLGYLVLAHQPLRLRDIRKELPVLLLSGAAMGVNWILYCFRPTSIPPFPALR